MTKRTRHNFTLSEEVMNLLLLNSTLLNRSMSNLIEQSVKYYLGAKDE